MPLGIDAQSRQLAALANAATHDGTSDSRPAPRRGGSSSLRDRRCRSASAASTPYWPEAARRRPALGRQFPSRTSATPRCLERLAQRGRRQPGFRHRPRYSLPRKLAPGRGAELGVGNRLIPAGCEWSLGRSSPGGLNENSLRLGEGNNCSPKLHEPARLLLR
jgi:hypothetical protein